MGRNPVLAGLVASAAYGVRAKRGRTGVKFPSSSNVLYVLTSFLVLNISHPIHRISTPWKEGVQRWCGLRCLNEDRCKYIFAIVAHGSMEFPQTCDEILCMVLQHGLPKTVGGKRVEGEVFPSWSRMRIYSFVSRFFHAPAEACISAARHIEF